MIQELTKALLINAAYVGAVAVCEQTQNGGVPIDPLIQDTNLQGKGVMVYEEAKVQYAALLRAFHDKSGIWPDPKVNEGTGSRGQGSGVTSPGLTDVVQQGLGLLSKLPRETPIGTIGQLLDLAVHFTTAPKQPGGELK